MNRLFESTTLKLTGWYLMILMTLSLLFSIILFQLASAELARGLRAPMRGVLFNSGLFVENQASRELRESRYQEGVSRLVANLVVLNVATLVLGGGLSYILARRTLLPIQTAMEAQGRFTSDASHELRTPLTVMKSEIEVGLRDKAATKTSYRELLESNLEEVDRLRELSDRLMLLASDKELPLKPQPLDEIAIDAVSSIVSLAQQKKITVVNDVKPVTVLADAGSLADALTILLDNAIKYSPELTTITVASEVKGRSAMLHVADEGPGIEPDDMAYIFDRFYRADSSRSRQHVAGYGLGLSIAQRIVKQHHGQLTAKNKPQGGAIFTIKLPIAHERQPT